MQVIIQQFLLQLEKQGLEVVWYALEAHDWGRKHKGWSGFPLKTKILHIGWRVTPSIRQLQLAQKAWRSVLRGESHASREYKQAWSLP